jgi:hypothetical protein
VFSGKRPRVQVRVPRCALPFQNLWLNFLRGPNPSWPPRLGTPLAESKRQLRKHKPDARYVFCSTCLTVLFILGNLCCTVAPTRQHDAVPVASVLIPSLPATDPTTRADAASKVQSSNPGTTTPKSCTQQIEELQAQVPEQQRQLSDAERQQLLLFAKAEPLFFVDTPKFTYDVEMPSVARNRALLARTLHPWDVIGRLAEQYKIAPKEGRDTLLQDGYLYTENPELAYALVNLIAAEHLFGHSQIWLQRGSDLFHAKRRSGRYWFTDGPTPGEQVRLLLFDRIGVGDAPSNVLGLDFRKLRYELLFSEAKIRTATKRLVVADLRYGTEWVPTLLAVEGARLERLCEVSNAPEALAQFRTEAARQLYVVQALRAVILAEVSEQLPFDEPRREWGAQMDGRLRRNWQYAYFKGKTSFAVNGDEYPVFDRYGRPSVPQVCVDFLVDTLERLGGSWFTAQGTRPSRSSGRISLGPSDPAERALFRRVPDLVEWVRANPDKFELLDVPEAERVPLADREGLLRYLTAHKEDFQPGDIVIIRGPTPLDPEQLHYHSFFIYESDPLSGLPIAVVGNAGRPTVRALETEIRRTPERSVLHRIRPRSAWLAEQLSPEWTHLNGPPPLSPPGNAGQ